MTDLFTHVRKLLNYVAKNFKLGSFSLEPRSLLVDSLNRVIRVVIHRVYRDSHQYAMFCRQTSRALGVSVKLIPRWRISTRKDDTPTAE